MKRFESIMMDAFRILMGAGIVMLFLQAFEIATEMMWLYYMVVFIAVFIILSILGMIVHLKGR